MRWQSKVGRQQDRQVVGQLAVGSQGRHGGKPLRRGACRPGVGSSKQVPPHQPPALPSFTPVEGWMDQHTPIATPITM